LPGFVTAGAILGLACQRLRPGRSEDEPLAGRHRCVGDRGRT
jgi:hypothetical protein